ncbi:MAG: LysR family transcriptional regulator [Rickettsiales bacterium]|nr:LysR family transcriptional regulator [Rickettsiales bacterium]
MNIKETKTNVENTKDKGKKDETGEKTPYSAFYYKKDRLSQIRGFCSLVQEGDIVKAAHKSGVESATISKQIKALQRDLGAHLFQEKQNLKGRLVLSEEGMRFYERAILLVHGMDSIYREFAANMEYERNNILRIAGVNFVLSDILPKYIYKLKAMSEFKDLVIEICDIPREEAFKRLKNKEIDIAFYAGKYNHTYNPEISQYLINKDSACIIFDKNHPLSKIKDPTKEEIEKYPNMFLKTYYSYDPNEVFNFTKKNFAFENLDWSLIKEYIYKTKNLMLVTKSFYNRIFQTDKRFLSIDTDKFGINLGIYYCLLSNMKNKTAVNKLVKLIKKV